MWEVTGGSGQGGAGKAGLAGLGWTPEGRRGERVRRGPGSAAPPAAAGAAVAWLPLLPWQQRRCQLANESPSAADNNTTVVNRAKPEAPQEPGVGTRYQVDPRSSPPALEPLPPPPWVSGLASPPGPSARLLSPPCSGHPSTPVRPCKDRRAGASMPDAEQQRPPPPPHLPPWEDTLPMLSPAHGLLVGVLSPWTGCRSHTPQWEALPR